MSMKYIRDHYRVPAKRGARIVYSGDGMACGGTIVGTSGPHLRVRLDILNNAIVTLHPTWEVEYTKESAAA